MLSVYPQNFAIIHSVQSCDTKPIFMSVEGAHVLPTCFNNFVIFGNQQKRSLSGITQQKVVYIPDNET